MQHKKLKLTIILLFFFGLTTVHAQTVKDIDGNVYTSVTIGTQVWMVENLKTTKYRNGDLIGTTTTATLDISLETTPKYQWAYDGNESNVNTYGRLYTWYAVMDSRNVCPTGWHVPSDAEWTTLTTYLGGKRVASGKLKEIGTTHWLNPNTRATNETGFTALPSGARSNRGPFYTIGCFSIWWSSTESSTLDAYILRLTCDSRKVYPNSGYKRDGFSIRCLKDN